MMPTKNDFIQRIQELKNDNRGNGIEFIEILASDLHRNLGHYPGTNHRMASCCDAMYELMESQKGDFIVSKPPKGRGATLKIRYYL